MSNLAAAVVDTQTAITNNSRGVKQEKALNDYLEATIREAQRQVYLVLFGEDEVDLDRHAVIKY